MLFGYLIDATAENWFHDSMTRLVKNINDAFISKATVIPDWIQAFPPEHQQRMAAQGVFKDCVDKYIKKARELSQGELKLVNSALAKQNNIQLLLSNKTRCPKTNQLPPKIQQPIKDLFLAGFELIKTLKIRKRQYEIIYPSMPAKVCPFCGISLFYPPDTSDMYDDTSGKDINMALDHYLPKHIYSLAGTNLLNLVPICSECNSKHKVQKDILYADRKKGKRRKMFFPYMHTGIKISLINSTLFDTTTGKLAPSWKINFIPNSVEAKSWDEVFEIRTRYKALILNSNFKIWLAQFQGWYISKKPDTDVIALLDEYIELESLSFLPFTKEATRTQHYWSSCNFLRLAFFEMLSYKCRKGDQNLITFLYDLGI